MASLIKHDAFGFAVIQDPVGDFEISYNPDTRRWHVEDRNEYGDLETRATFAGDRKGFHNARQWAKRKTVWNRLVLAELNS